MNIKMDYTVIPGVSTNCYLLINKDTDEAVIIDPAGNEIGRASCRERV